MEHTYILAIAIPLALTAVMLFMSYRRTSFEHRFPPISDAEFLSRLPPGTNAAVALRVRKIVSDHLNIEYSRIYPSSRFSDDLNAE